MTLAEAMDLTDQMRPNMMGRQVKLRYLTEIDGMIYKELLLKHEHSEDEEGMPYYDIDTDEGTELLVPGPYDMVYVYWLMCKIDILNMEYDKYNNDRAMFDNAYEQMSDWWTRTRMPLQETRELTL